MFTKTLLEDFEKLLFCLSLKYNLPYSELTKRYLPNIVLYKKEKRKRKFKVKNRYVLYSKYRCEARCMNIQRPVTYDPVNKKYIYGSQCKRKKYGLFNYCLTHQKQYEKYGTPYHGDFDKEVPHNHFLKYKKKIDLNVE